MGNKAENQNNIKRKVLKRIKLIIIILVLLYIIINAIFMFTFPVLIQYNHGGGWIWGGFDSYYVVDPIVGIQVYVPKFILKMRDEDYENNYTYKYDEMAELPSNIGGIMDIIGSLDDSSILFLAQSNQPPHQTMIYSYDHQLHKYTFITDLPITSAVANGSKIYYLENVGKFRRYILYEYDIETKETKKLRDIETDKNIKLMRYLK